jgi:hypothetical protein
MWHNEGGQVIRFSDGRIVNMETGELVGDLPPVDARAIRLDMLPPEAKTAAGPKPMPPDFHSGPWPYWCPHAAGDMWACRACNYGYEYADGPEGTAMASVIALGDGATWHYSGDGMRVGVDAQGRDVRQDLKTGKVSRIYSVQMRRDAVEFAERFGAAHASRKFHIPAKTVQGWVNRGIG